MSPRPLTAAALLVALTVIVHAVGLMLIFAWVSHSHLTKEKRFWGGTWLVIRVAWALLLVHVIGIGAWAIFYWRNHSMPDLESAVYFSGVTYTSVGYGDLVLSKPWRVLAPVEALTGLLMGGLSTGFFFALVSTLVAKSRQAEGR
jgi:ion channel